MAIDYDVLRTEITTDPKGLGYAGEHDPEVAELLNTIGLSSEEVTREPVDTREAQEQIVGSEWAALSDAMQRLWIAIVSVGTLDPDNSVTVAQIGTVWGSGTATRTNLQALATRSCSRAEALFGAGTSITHLDVAKAR